MTYLPLFDHLWQSTVFAAAAGLLTLALRTNRARVRHAVWLAASIKFAIPLSLLIALGTQLQWHPVQQRTGSDLAFAVVQVSEPFTASLSLTPAKAPVRPKANSLPAILAVIWAAGFFGISIATCVRWRRVRKMVAAGTHVDLQLPIPGVVSSTLVEPGVYGIVRPILVLPAGVFERLTPAQLDTVIAHELEHVRHRDNLAAAWQMLVETVFWFHPLVWWMGGRMLAERERACDEGVVRRGNERRVYAEAVLTVCKLYVESPLECVSGISGSNLKRRIEAIMRGRNPRELHFAKKVGLAAAGLIALSAPVWVGMMHAPAMWAQSPVLPAAPAAPEVHATTQVHVAPEVHAVAIEKPRPVVPQAIALAPQVALPPEPQVPAGSTAAEVRQIRGAYAKANFKGDAMVSAYTWYGPPTKKSREGDIETWHYDYLDLYKSDVTIQFSSSAGGRVTWPAQKSFEGGTTSEPAANLLGKALTNNADLPEGSIKTSLPGRHAYVEPGLRVNTVEQFMNLVIPMDTISGPVDVIAQVSDEWKVRVANVRDSVESKGGAWASTFVVIPGSYECDILVREKTSGLMYAEAIPFQVTRVR